MTSGSAVQYLINWATTADLDLQLQKLIFNKRLQVAFTHARVHMGASVYSPGPEED